MTTTEAPPTPEQLAQIQARQQAIFAQPVPLPVNYGVASVQTPDGNSAIVLEIITPAGSQRIVLSPDDAEAMAAAIRKQARTGPTLVKAPAGLVIPRA